MNTESLKISIAQRILSLNDDKILIKISKLLNKENIVGYDMDGNPISENEYVADIHNTLHSLAEGKLETYSGEEVKRKIIGSFPILTH